MVSAFLLVAVLLLALVAPERAEAQTCSATVTDIDFGSPNLMSSAYTDALGTLTVTCTRVPFLSVVKVCPNIGDGSGDSSGSSRLMRSSGNGSLAFQLFQDSSRTLGWGAVDEPQLGTVPPLLINGGLTGAGTITATIYARLFGSQASAPPGQYSTVFSGGDTAFTYSSFFLGTNSSCVGFVGSSTIRPSFDVTATAQAGCTLSATDLDFGAIGVLTSSVSAQTSLRVACTRDTPFSVSLDGGTGNTAPTARRMTSSAGDGITYGLYRDTARALAWGNTAANRASGTGTGAEQAFQIYGLVPTQATPKPGLYSDRIVVTVAY